MNAQVVLITGALTGIGRATALAFAKEGAQVVVSGRRDEEGQKLVSQIRKAGAEAEFIRADVRREEDVRNLIDKTVERFGRLDVAVNCRYGRRARPYNGANCGQLRGNVRYQCARHVVEHEARTSRDAATKKRLHREHILHIWAYRRAWSFCLFRQQTCGGGTHEVGGAGSGRDGRAGECHCPRTNRNTNAESLHENRRKKGWFGLDRSAKARGKTRRDCSSYRFCFLRQSLLHHGSFLPRRRRQNGPITLTRGHTRSGWRIKMNQTIEEKNKAARPKAFDTLFNKRDYAAAKRYGPPTIFSTALISSLAATVCSIS